MKHAVHAEWTKLRTLPSTGWLLLALVVCTVLAGAATTGAVSTENCPTPARCFEDTTELSLTGVRLGQAVAVVLAVLAVSNEYSTGMIRATLTAYPRRRVLLPAKAAVLTATVLGAGTLAVLGSLAVGRALLPGNGFTEADGYPPLSLTDGPTLRAAVGTVLYLALVALLALGVAAVLRDTAAALTCVLTLLYLAPVLTELVSDPDWQERLQRYAPMPAGLAVQATTHLDQQPIAPWPGLAVLAAYAAAALLAGALLTVRRDP